MVDEDDDDSDDDDDDDNDDINDDDDRSQVCRLTRWQRTDCAQVWNSHNWSACDGWMQLLSYDEDDDDDDDDDGDDDENSGRLGACTTG